MVVGDNCTTDWIAIPCATTSTDGSAVQSPGTKPSKEKSFQKITVLVNESFLQLQVLKLYFVKYYFMTKKICIQFEDFVISNKQNWARINFFSFATTTTRQCNRASGTRKKSTTFKAVVSRWKSHNVYSNK